MDTNVVYNATVTIIGVAILLIHAINIVLKKDRRKDENALLAFISFTIIHFATYFAFVIYKSQNETSDTYIMSFYTVFYVMNNIEMLLFYLYMTSYTKFNAKVKKATDIINLVLFSLFVISDILNLFFHFYFSAENGNYERTSYMIISQGYQFVMLVICLLIAILAKKLRGTEITIAHGHDTTRNTHALVSHSFQISQLPIPRNNGGTTPSTSRVITRRQPFAENGSRKTTLKKHRLLKNGAFLCYIV